MKSQHSSLYLTFSSLPLAYLSVELFYSEKFTYSFLFDYKKITWVYVLCNTIIYFNRCYILIAIYYSYAIKRI